MARVRGLASDHRHRRPRWALTRADVSRSTTEHVRKRAHELVDGGNLTVLGNELETSRRQPRARPSGRPSSPRGITGHSSTSPPGACNITGELCLWCRVPAFFLVLALT